MSKYIVKFVLIVFGVAVGSALVATVIWYFLSAQANINLSSVLFWCGLGLIGLGVLLFGGHGERDLAPGDYRSADAIDPDDMAYGKSLKYLSDSIFLVMFCAGCVVAGVSFFVV